jgi:hypothetical protein
VTLRELSTPMRNHLHSVVIDDLPIVTVVVNCESTVYPLNILHETPMIGYPGGVLDALLTRVGRAVSYRA